MKTNNTLSKCLFLFGMIVSSIGAYAQVKMGNNPQTIGASSLLELESTSKALVITRMTTAQIAAISAPVAGMLVYNTDSNCIVQRTSTAWKYLCSTGGNSSPLNWQVNGNSGTNSGSNFLGTTNNTSLKIKTNNIQRMIVDSTGKVGIGAATPENLLHLYSNSSPATSLKIEHGASGVDYTDADLLLVSQNAGSDRGLGVFMHKAPAQVEWFAGMPYTNLDRYIISRANGVSNHDGATAQSANTLFMINSSGNTGIGTTNPGSKLDVKGTLRLSGATSGYVGLSPAAAAGSTTYTLPSADGSSNQVLSTNGAGTLSWATPTSVTGISTTASMVEEFMFDIENSYSQHLLMWNAVGNAAMRYSISGHPGVAEVYTTGISGYYSDLQSTMQVLPTELFDITWCVRPASTGTLTNATYRIGVISDDQNQPTDGIYFEKLPGDTYWYGVNRASNTQTRTATSATVVASTWYTLRLRRIDSSTIGFSINGGSEVTSTTNIPTALCYFGFLVKTSENNPKYLHADYVSMTINGLSR